MSFVQSMAALGLVLALTGLPAADEAHAADRVNPFLKAKTWGYQLRNLESAERAKIAASPFDLVVTDYARGENRNEIPLTRDEVEAMKARPDGSKRLIIAYLSIGETENYRSYWKPEWDKQRPAWMGKENKEWRANYLAKYWEPEWQKIIFGSPEAYIDRVLAAGFDGFYFDRVDAYYYFGDNEDVRKKMRDFIVKLANYVRAKKPDAAIMVQNAEELLTSKDYVEAIDGIAKESLFYGIKGADKLNPQSDIVETTDLLKKASGQGKAIFVVEYLKDKKNVADAAARMDKLGWSLYIGTRGLARLGKNSLEPAAPDADDFDEIGAIEKKSATKKKSAKAN